MLRKYYVQVKCVLNKKGLLHTLSQRGTQQSLNFSFYLPVLPRLVNGSPLAQSGQVAGS